MLEHEVALDDSGFAIVSVYIRPKNTPTMAQARYKIDTGASCTTITSKWLLDHGYDENWIKSGKPLIGDARPTVASGLPINDCYEVILPEIRIGEWVGYNWPFITSLSVPFKFLLGTDSMRFFKWYFDYERDVCSFEFIPEKRRILFNGKEQSIHAIDEIR